MFNSWILIWLILLKGDEIISLSSDSILNDSDAINIFPVEFLNSLIISGMPPYKLVLKKKQPIKLLRDIDSESGLCNGTWVIIRNVCTRIM